MITSRSKVNTLFASGNSEFYVGKKWLFSADIALHQHFAKNQDRNIITQQGDKAAQEVCQTYIFYLAEGIVNLVNLLHPDMLAIGGGVSNERDEALLTPVREIVDRECYARHGGRLTKIVKAQLGNDAGIIGAALLGKQY